MKKLIFVIPLLLMFLPGMAQVYTYENSYKKSGEVIDHYEMKVTETARGYDITGIKEGEDSLMRIGKDFSGIQVQVKYENGDYFQMKREANTIVVDTKKDGEESHKTHKIDKKAWFCDPALSISGMIKAGKKEVEFWTISPMDDDVYEMVASVKGEETFEIKGKKYDAVKVHWTLDGWKSIFWGADLWYRKSDGVLLAQEFSTGPGSKARLSRLVAESEVK